MHQKGRWTYWAGWAVMASVMLGACAGSNTTGAGPSAGMPPPVLSEPEGPGVALVLPKVGGGQVAIQDLRGHPVLLTLFTTWCLRCQVEAPWFVRLHERYADDGLAVVGIALDKELKVSLIQTYADYVGMTFPVLLATPDNLELVGALGITRQVPRTVLLDARGRVILDQEGQTDLEALRRAVDKALESAR